MRTIYLRITHNPGPPAAKRARFVQHQYASFLSPEQEVRQLNFHAADKDLYLEYELSSAVEYHAALLA